MGDNVTFQSAAPATPPSSTVVSTEEVSTLNGAGVTAQQVQRVIPALRTADGTAIDLNGENHLGEVGASATTCDATLTRPNDANAYTANDEITDVGGAVLTFANAARVSGGSGYITDVLVVDSANVATKAQLVLFVYDTTSTPATDNAPFAPTDGVQNTCVAIIPINIWYPGDDTSGAGGNAIGVYGGPPISFKCSGSANLFGRVKVLNAYAPVNSEAFKFRVKVRRD